MAASAKVNLSTAMDIHANFHEKVVEMEKKYHQIAQINQMLFRLNTEHNLAYTGLLPKQVAEQMLCTQNIYLAPTLVLLELGKFSAFSHSFDDQGYLTI